MPAIVARIFSQLLASAEKPADESAYNRRAKRHPAVVIAAVMMVDFMTFMVVAWCRTMMFLGRVMFRCRRTLYRLMSWGGFGRASFAAMRSCHNGTAESCTGKSENHKFFECFVHITPSLSFFVVLCGPSSPLTKRQGLIVLFSDKEFFGFSDTAEMSARGDGSW
ncbi:MAG: hypothetical protein IKL85_10085 [Lentisphaeria bacterium]|nr:hypothetical protein [Lentisphaeria bacterium]